MTSNDLDIKTLIINKINYFGKNFGHLEKPDFGKPKSRGDRYSSVFVNGKHISEATENDFLSLSNEELIEVLVLVTRKSFIQM